MRRWMYVYLAVDVWTYDLLHIAIYPSTTSIAPKAFLLVLRTKGYHPDVIITDLRQDYGTVIPQVFPSATHHLCIFHALQTSRNTSRYLRPQLRPRLTRSQTTQQLIYNIFDTQSLPKRSSATSKSSPSKMLTHKHPASTVIFDFWYSTGRKLVNAIGSDKIPTTNNATELVIRRFDQHYQNFCGFESIKAPNATWRL